MASCYKEVDAHSHAQPCAAIEQRLRQIETNPACRCFVFEDVIVVAGGKCETHTKTN
jgi:hypothetical protein